MGVGYYWGMWCHSFHLIGRIGHSMPLDGGKVLMGHVVPLHLSYRTTCNRSQGASGLGWLY